MPVQVQCPNPACGKASKVPDGYLGRTVRCPICREKFKLSADGIPSPAGTSSVVHPPANQTHVPASNTFGPSPSVAALTTQPEQIGRFHIRARLGAGAFGTVYRAHDPQLEREVALKVPQDGTLDSPQAVERFLREAKSAARLCHANIVPVYDAGQDGDLYFIASAFIEGRTLAKAITEGGLDERQAVQIVRHLAEALAYAHRQGIVHRDVKPANVMLNARGTPHLMDFGLAHQQDATQKLTQDGAILGTPAYMAPEMAQGQSDKPQPASDQYSLGVVLYELLCGQTPFCGPPQIVLFNAIHREPPAPRSLKPNVPLDLETICLKALAKRPEERYATCQEMADDLRRWLDGDPIQARRMGLVERVGRWVRREPKVAGLMAVVMLVLVVGIAVSAYFAVLADLKTAEAQASAEQARQEQERAQLAENLAKENAAKTEQQRTIADASLARSRATEQDLQDVLQQGRERERKLQNTLDELNRERQVAAKAGQEVKSIQKSADKATQTAERERRRNFQKQVSIPPKPFSNIVFHPDGQRVFFASQTDVHLWDTNKPKIDGLAKHSSTAKCLSMSKDGRLLAFAGHENTISIWDLITRKIAASILVKCSVLAFGLSDNLLVGRYGRVELLKTDLGGGPNPILFANKTTDGRGTVGSLAFRQDWSVAAIGFNLFGGEEYEVRIVDAETGELDRILGRRFGQIVGLALHPKGKHMATVCQNAKVVQVWDMRISMTSGRDRYFDSIARTVPGERMVAYSPDGKLLATVMQREILLYNAYTGAEVRRIPNHAALVTSIAFSPDGNRMVSISEDKTARLWDVSSELDEPDKPEVPSERKP